MLLPAEEGDSHQTMGTGGSTEEEETLPEGTVNVLTNSNGEPVYETVSVDSLEEESTERASDEYIEGEDDGSELPYMLPENAGINEPIVELPPAEGSSGEEEETE